MDKLRVGCLSCGKEMEGHTSRTYSCGCPNMTTIHGDSVTAVDLSQVIMVQSGIHNNDTGLSSQDLEWQERRRKRKIRKLDFEDR